MKSRFYYEMTAHKREHTDKSVTNVIHTGDKEPFYQFFLMDDILDRPEEFEKLAIRQVLGAWPMRFGVLHFLFNLHLSST